MLLVISTAYLYSFLSCYEQNIVVVLINYNFVKMSTLMFIELRMPTELVLVYLLLLLSWYLDPSHLGGSQDSSIVYQCQSTKPFRFKTIPKCMLPVIILNLFYTSSFHACEITSLNIELQRNTMHIKNVTFPCRSLKMPCTNKCLVYQIDSYVILSRVSLYYLIHIF